VRPRPLEAVVSTPFPHLLDYTPMTQLGDPAPAPFRLATWNLRYDIQPDGIPVATSLAALPHPRAAPPPIPPGEQPWSARRVRVAQRLCASHVDLVGAFRIGWAVVLMLMAHYEHARISGSTCQAGPRPRGTPGQRFCVGALFSHATALVPSHRIHYPSLDSSATSFMWSCRLAWVGMMASHQANFVPSSTGGE